jgi:hypothetical protein
MGDELIRNHATFEFPVTPNRPRTRRRSSFGQKPAKVEGRTHAIG